MKDFTPTSYTLECVATGREFEDTGWMLSDPQCKTPSLIRAKYARRQLEVKPAEYGLYRFCDWMPVRRILKGSSAPVTYKSKGLAAHLGLENLWITFNGYYPAIGATMSTCSFKETEAYSVCGRAAEHEDRVLVVASAGNTARAFAKVCSDNNIKLLLSVPYDNIGALWFEHPLDPCVKLISCAAGVALASLINAVAAGKVEKDATVMLNVTGGGEEHFKEGKELWYLKPSHVFPLEPDTDDVVAKVEALFN